MDLGTTLFQPYQLPLTSNYPFFTFTIVLSGTVFSLTFRYNIRMDRWFMDIADASGVLIVSGLPLLIQADIIGQYTKEGLPAGRFIVYDLTNESPAQQPTRYSWGSTHAVYYYDPVGSL